jgi:hypothetical protein
MMGWADYNGAHTQLERPKWFFYVSKVRVSKRMCVRPRHATGRRRRKRELLSPTRRKKYFFLFYFSQIYSLLYNGAISKYVVRKHLSGAIIQWWFSYIYCALCCACLYSFPSLWSKGLYIYSICSIIFFPVLDITVKDIYFRTKVLKRILKRKGNMVRRKLSSVSNYELRNFTPHLVSWRYWNLYYVYFGI